MSIKTYKPKPMTIRAVQADGSEASVIDAMGLIGSTQGVLRMEGGLRVDRPEGSMIVPNGGYLALLPHGRLRCFPKEDFLLFFEAFTPKIKRRTGSVWKPRGYKVYMGKTVIDKTPFYQTFTEDKEESIRLRNAWAKNLRAKNDRGEHAKTWQFFKEAYLSQLQHKLLNPYTLEKYTRALARVEEVLKPKLLTELTITSINRFIDVLKKDADARGVGYHSVNQTISCLRQALKYAVKADWHPTLRTEGIETLPIKNAEVHIFTPEELNIMLYYSSPVWRAALLLGVQCSHRSGEIINQLWDDIYPDIKGGRIETHLEDPARGIRFWRPKCGKSRNFCLTDTLIEVLTQMRRRGAYVVTNKYGKPYKDDGAFYAAFQEHLDFINKKASKDLGRKIKIQGSPKMLRKSFASLLQANGAALKDVALAMGHARTSTTINNYTKQDLKGIVKRDLENIRQLQQFQVKLDFKKAPPKTLP